MAPDERKTVGAHVNTIATSVTNYLECGSLFNASYKTRRVNGIDRKALVTQPVSGHASTVLELNEI